MSKINTSELDDLKTKRERLGTELKALNDRLASCTDPQVKAGLVQRGANLTTALANISADLVKAESAFADAMIAEYTAGRIDGENGDGCGPVSIKQHRVQRGAGAVRGGPSIAGALVDAMDRVKFHPKTNPSVEVPGFGAWATKAQTIPSMADLSPSQRIVTPLGQDVRFMWSAMPLQDAGTDTSIEDFRITAATVSGTIERSPSATGTKADLATTTTLANDPMKQFAITISDIPNILFNSTPMLAQYMQQQAEFELEKALDAHVLAQIVAATPPFGNSGTGLITQIRKGLTAMRATGAAPSLLVVNPTDSELLDTYMTADGIFLLDNPSTGGSGTTPVWNLRRIERIGAGTEPPYLIDPTMLGVLYLGAVRIDADPYTGFKENTTTLRVEFEALMHVRNANGARRIAAS